MKRLPSRQILFYAQRTADDRIAIGGLDVGYPYGSNVKRGWESGPKRAHGRLERLLKTFFPMIPDLRIDARWSGVMGVPRDWQPSVGCDLASGFAWVGGYVGEGVAAANLAGRTLADLIAEVKTDITALPWVNHRSPS